ncbi:Fe2+/Zn2+ uptake regulation protein [Mycolicibacterium litorale]|nr:Fe2+/Zn2+ uptake regulation protein [Mycolicibacterium litorale]
MSAEPGGPESASTKRRRNTAKQRAVLEVLGTSERFRSAQQLFVVLRSQRPMRIGLTSVYRILRTLADDQIAETQRAEDGETLYRLRTEPGHRHYLICRLCGRAVGFIPTAIEEQTTGLSAQHGFSDVTHYVDVYGICPQCLRAPVTDDR